MRDSLATILRPGVCAAAVGLALAAAGLAEAGGRYMSGGHPYHNGYYFIPPASAYTAVTVRPPMHYGAPAYYYPQSYLAPAPYSVSPAPWYPGVPFSAAGGYYMSAHGYYTAYPW